MPLPEKVIRRCCAALRRVTLTFVGDDREFNSPFIICSCLLQWLPIVNIKYFVREYKDYKYHASGMT